MIMKGEERRAFTTAKLSLVHNLTVDCLTFAHFLLPSHTFNDFLGHHHHWMEWLGATIDINGFSMVLRSGNHWFQWFTMVFHHWSNDGMVAYHRWSLYPCMKYIVPHPLAVSSWWESRGSYAKHWVSKQFEQYFQIFKQFNVDPSQGK